MQFSRKPQDFLNFLKLKHTLITINQLLQTHQFSISDSHATLVKMAVHLSPIELVPQEIFDAIIENLDLEDLDGVFQSSKTLRIKTIPLRNKRWFSVLKRFNMDFSFPIHFNKEYDYKRLARRAINSDAVASRCELCNKCDSRNCSLLQLEIMWREDEMHYS